MQEDVLPGAVTKFYHVLQDKSHSHCMAQRLTEWLPHHSPLPLALNTELKTGKKKARGENGGVDKDPSIISSSA